MLPDELVELLLQSFPCRDEQLRALTALYASGLPSPSTLVVHGPEATAKSRLIASFLKHSSVPFAVVNSRECITGRHLLERTMEAVGKSLEPYRRCAGRTIEDRGIRQCESLSSLAVGLEKLLDDFTKANDENIDEEVNGQSQLVMEARRKFVLVFDHIDRQREPPATLLPALIRIAESLPSLRIILIMRVACPRALHSAAVPHLFFPAYERNQALQILALDPLPIFTKRDPTIEYTAEEEAEDNEYVWSRFCGVVWDTLGKAAARDIVSLREVCERLWRPFCSKIEDGTFGTRDFARLLVSRKALFQDENVLVPQVIPAPISAGTVTATARVGKAGGQTVAHALPTTTKYLLVASYLASYNPARSDMQLFSQVSAKKRRRNTGPTRASQKRRIPRHLLNPSPFPLERLLAVLRAILPDGRGVVQVGEVYTQIATLTALRLLLKTGGAAGAIDGGIEGGARWRVNFGWEYVVSVGRSVGIDVGEWIVGGGE